MQTRWINSEDNPNVALFVLGWACGPELVQHLSLPGYDIICVYDYKDFDPVTAASELLADTSPYEEIDLFAWSFGVWAAEKILTNEKSSASLRKKLKRAVALNGTPFPADPKKGIGARRLNVTIRGFRSAGTGAFMRKAYAEHYDELEDCVSGRNVADDIRELETLTNLSAEPYTPSIEWTRAVVGSRDEIFPPDNMINYWGELAEILPLPHYPFGKGAILK